MHRILFIIQKEFIQIFRDRTMLPIIFLVPLIQMIILVYAATLEMKSIDMVIVDQDHSPLSRELRGKFEGSPFFRLRGVAESMALAERELHSDRADIILNIPADFEEAMVRNESSGVQLLISAINATAAGLTQAYSRRIIMAFIQEHMPQGSETVALPHISVESSFWYNPELDYKIYMLPGILVILVTIIGAFLTALNIVREKEKGTIEQINVTPVRKYQFITGKLVPFWIIAMLELAFGLSLGRLLFQIPVEGSLWVLFGFTAVYLLVALGIGLLISTMAGTQQQVMFIIFFFMLTFILMSGIFTPVESMPDWAHAVNIINPFAYFMRVIRMLLLKGSGFWEISKEFFSLLVYGSIMLGLAVWRYQKTT
ncbi:MAG: ABC transporter permease [Bacteroidales bacterium]|nr:ABC transporter permease [Bacteroidales bacterium]